MGGRWIWVGETGEGDAARRRGTLLPLILLSALACGPGPAEPGPVVESVELVLGFDEPVTIADDPTATSTTSVVLPPGEGAGAFDGILDIEDANGTASELRLHVQVE